MTVEQRFARQPAADEYRVGSPVSLFPCIQTFDRRYTGCIGSERCRAWRGERVLPASCILEAGYRKPLDTAKRIVSNVELRMAV